MLSECLLSKETISQKMNVCYNLLIKSLRLVLQIAQSLVSDPKDMSP